MYLNRLLTFLLVAVINLCIFPSALSELYSYVTCGSVIKLINNHLKFRLHSHEVKYGSGSHQQSVTGIDDTDDVSSHWVVKGKSGKTCKRGEPITCGMTVRLEHLVTKKNLHSHHFHSPLSNNQEVSCFGESGEGDTGDHWVVTCSSDYWERNGNVRFKHADTDMWMAMSGNTYGRPISGQKEVCALPYSDSSCFWKTVEGVYIKPTDPPNPAIGHVHSEL